MKNYFLIGDVHGCFYTFEELLSFADLQNDKIIQVGDLIDRGNFSDLCIERAMFLEKEHDAVFLMGNHEFEGLRHFNETYNHSWFRQGGLETIIQLSSSLNDLSYYLEWISQRPYYIESDHVFISHAGISGMAERDDHLHPQGILWNRSGLKNIGKVQVVGHTPFIEDQPVHFPESNSWNVDTGAYKGNGLSALRLNEEGERLAHFFVPTHKKDISQL